MHTSAQTLPPPEGDLFPELQPQHMRLAFTGVLRSHAQLRSKPVGADGLMLPVLCLELGDVGPMHQRVYAEQTFTEATRRTAEELVKTLRQGAEVTVYTAATDMRLHLPHVEQIQVDTPATHHH